LTTELLDTPPQLFVLFLGVHQKQVVVEDLTGPGAHIKKTFLKATEDANDEVIYGASMSLTMPVNIQGQNTDAESEESHVGVTFSLCGHPAPALSDKLPRWGGLSVALHLGLFYV